MLVRLVFGFVVSVAKILLIVRSLFVGIDEQ